MKKIICSFFFVYLFLNVQLNAQNAVEMSFHYTGSNWGKYEGHRLTIVVLDTSVGRTKLIAEQIIKNGEIDVTGKIKYPQNAFFGLYNPSGDFVYKQEFIAEPGNLKIDRDNVTDNISVTGGKYNPLFDAIANDPDCIAKAKKYMEYEASLKQSDFEIDSVKKKYTELRNASYKCPMDKYDAVRFNNPDPYARLLAIYHSSRIKMDEQLNELEKQIGTLPEIVYLRYSANAAKLRQSNSVTIKIGSIIKDFNADDLNGKAFHLTDVLKENKYTLVEFWASWCGPCRAEIPHMKTAYEKFNKKGFQIVSFTLDHERNRWVKASTEEKLPWINVGDMLAYKSPVVKMFGISGIPANYLVDPSGKIIAMNLRQEKLDEKLVELLGM